MGHFRFRARLQGELPEAWHNVKQKAAAGTRFGETIAW